MDSRRRQAIQQFETEIGNTQQAIDLLKLSLSYIRLYPEWYCQPSARGEQLRRPGLDYLLGVYANQRSRPIVELAEKAQQQNLNPDAVLASALSDRGIQQARDDANLLIQTIRRTRQKRERVAAQLRGDLC
ncbi:MAG: hypothetical protein AAFW84_24640 [Cyanobacteria bacterium J06635_15]